MGTGPEGVRGGIPSAISGLYRPCPALSRLWSGTQVWHPPFADLRRPSLVVILLFSRPPPAPLLARAAAANVNPRTRLSHMTETPPFLGS